MHRPDLRNPLLMTQAVSAQYYIVTESQGDLYWSLLGLSVTDILATDWRSEKKEYSKLGRESRRERTLLWDQQSVVSKSMADLVGKCI